MQNGARKGRRFAGVRGYIEILRYSTDDSGPKLMDKTDIFIPSYMRILERFYKKYAVYVRYLFIFSETVWRFR